MPGALEERPKRKLFGRKGPKEPGKKAKPAKAPKAAKQKKPKGAGAGKSSPVGLDIGRTSITAVQLKYQVGGATMLSAAVDRLPEGLIQEGEVRDVEALAFAIRDFWRTHKLKGRKVQLGLANQKVVVRTLEFPVLEEKELRSAIEFQAQDYIPIPIEEAVFDFHVLGRFSDESGIEKQKVLVVAAQKQMVLDFVNAIKKAKLSVFGIDLQAFAMLRALAPKSFLEAESPGTAVAMANIASDVTNLVVAVGGEPQFTRIISFGGDNFTRAIQEYRGIPFDEAEEMKARVGLTAPEERGMEPEAGAETAVIPPGEVPPEEPPEESPFEGPPPPEPGGPGQPGEAGPPAGMAGPGMPAGGESQGEVPWAGGGAGQKGTEGAEISEAEVKRVLEMTADALADEIRRSLDYYMSQESSAPITKLLLSGGGALLPNLDRHLTQIFPFDVIVGDPLRRITQNRSGLTDEELKGLGPRLAISIGLALEDEE